MLKKILIRFDSAWVMSRQKNRMNPLEAFLNSFSTVYDISVIHRSMTECEFVVLDESIPEDALSAKITEVLSRRFSMSYVHEIAHFTISDFAAGPDTRNTMEKWDREASIQRSRKAVEEARKKEEEAAKKKAEGSEKKSSSLEEMLAAFKRSMDTGEKPEEDKEEAPEETSESGEKEVPRDQCEEVKPASGERTEDPEAVLQAIDELVGAEDFKALAHELVKIGPGLIRHNALETLTHQCYLFAINVGGGLTTYMKLLARLLNVAGLFSSKEEARTMEISLGAPGSGAGMNPFNSAISALRGAKENSKRIICIDISEWMDEADKKLFRDFLSIVDRYLDNCIVIFRVPFVEQNVLSDLAKRIGDVLSVRELSFIPFDGDELVLCARRELEQRGFSMDEDAWQVFNARIAEEKSDGRFYGINTVRKVVREMIYSKQLDNACNGVDDTVIKKMEILRVAPTFDAKEQGGLEMLDAFVGMEKIKKQIEEIVLQIEVALQNKTLGSPCIHMRFIGNPGTGKTTVARVIGRVLKERGILRNGHFFEYGGRDLCGRFVGETSPKTAGMCRDAYGSVMFIDEAYTLYRGEGAGDVDYGREAIDTLIAQMENHRNDLVVIMAGYPDEMQTLMKANPGLESRMPYVIEFPNYTKEQLFEIYMRMVKRNFAYSEEFEGAVKTYFDSLPEEVLLSREFSNARFVRNIFERTWGKAYTRARMAKLDSVTLEKEDFLLASAEKEFKKSMEKPSKRTLGFV